MGMQVLAYDPYVSEDRMRSMNVGRAETADEVFERADFVSLHVPRTPQTMGLVNEDALAKMKSSAYLINVARGGIVDETALYNALKDGTIAGAALDVFAEEPTTDSPLFTLPNVVVTPHLGASTAGPGQSGHYGRRAGGDGPQGRCAGTRHKRPRADWGGRGVRGPVLGVVRVSGKSALPTHRPRW